MMMMMKYDLTSTFDNCGLIAQPAMMAVATATAAGHRFVL